MDPVTHALMGAATARVALARPLGHAAWLPGALGAVLPDADVFIRSAADPLLYAEFHRHFTHALAFVPIGATIASAPWLVARRRDVKRTWYWAAAAAGYATHGVLDASTTYGTTLLWPFSDVRVAWNWISIVDPLFTAVLLAGVGVAVWRRSARPAATALALCLAYLSAGAVQHERAIEVQSRVASSRGHSPARAAVFPGFMTNIVWRSLYEADGILHMDRLRLPWGGRPSWRPVTSVPALGEEDLPRDVVRDPRLIRDFRRFSWFTSGWTAPSPEDAAVVADARYSSSDMRFEAVWGIRFTPRASAPVEWIDRSGQRRIDISYWWSELQGTAAEYRVLPAPLGEEQ